MNRRTGIWAAVVSAACFGVLAVFTALAYERGAEPLQLLTWRFAIAAILLSGWIAVKRPGALRVPPEDLRRFALLSLGGYGAASLCFAFAVRYLEASLVAILLYTYPAMVTLSESIIERKRPTTGRVMAVVLAFGGCVFVVDPFGAQGQVSLLGVALGLGAGAGYAAFSVLSHRWLPGRSRSVMMTYLFAMTAVLAMTAAVVSGSALWPTGWDGSSWLLLAGIVLLPTFAAVLLYWRALRVLGASQAALISTFEPLFTIAFAAALLGESLSGYQWVGAGMVLAGVLVSETGSGVPEEIPAL